jgi:outer membrane protein assembly factor BamB
MRLSRLFLVYLLCTAGAICTPAAIALFDHGHKAVIPVNSEKPLEPAPVAFDPENKDVGLHTPGCIADDGTEYYADRWIAVNWQSFHWTFNKPTPRYFDSGRDNYSDGCAVGWDETIYVLGHIDDKHRTLRAFSPSGEMQWSSQLPDTRSDLAISRTGTVYVVAGPRLDVADLMAFDREGTLLWTTPASRTGNGVWELTAPAIGPDGTIYVISAMHDQATLKPASTLTAFSPKGERLWSAALDGLAKDFVIGADGSIFVHLQPGEVVAFDAQGHQKWKFESGHEGNDGSLVLGQDGTLYFPSRFLYALDPQGKTKWSFKSEITYTKGDYFDQPPLIGDDGTIYAGSCYGQYYAITHEGQKKWQLSVSAEPGILTSNGILISSGKRYRVSGALAKDGWPSKNRDNANRRSQEVAQ